MISFIKSTYLSPRFFYAFGAISILFLISYWWEGLYGIIWVLVVIFILLVLLEIVMIYKHQGLQASRRLPEKFSNSDLNPVSVVLQNRFSFKISVTIIDELPFQFQKRDFSRKLEIPGQQNVTMSYEVRPVERGEYTFGKLNCYISSPLGIIQRRFTFDNEQMVKVYPSFLQMKKVDFLALDQRISTYGFRKIRRIGHTMEFEQIKDYVSGDDVRTVNWKATAKKGHLMVNQFQDEKMQPVYSIIDTSRVMKMPFNGLSLLDYSINSTLAFSNIALKKNDKVGMLDFSNKIGNFLPAVAKKTYLHFILENLYNIKTKFLDADFGMLQATIQRRIRNRSLIMLYTNFEHISALRRQLPYLQAISKKHLLVVIFFENTELKSLVSKKADNVREIMDQTIAQQFDLDKKLMVRELQQRGIQTVLTSPEDLTVNSINKYLEIKARGML